MVDSIFGVATRVNAIIDHSVSPWTGTEFITNVLVDMLSVVRPPVGVDPIRKCSPCPDRSLIHEYFRSLYILFYLFFKAVDWKRTNRWANWDMRVVESDVLCFDPASSALVDGCNITRLVPNLSDGGVLLIPGLYWYGNTVCLGGHLLVVEWYIVVGEYWRRYQVSIYTRAFAEVEAKAPSSVICEASACLVKVELRERN